MKKNVSGKKRGEKSVADFDHDEERKSCNNMMIHEHS